MNQVSHSVLPVSENIGESGRSRRELKVGAKKSGRSKNSKWIKKTGVTDFQQEQARVVGNEEPDKN